MIVNTRKGPIFDPGLCRCCGAIKKCRLLNVEYEWNGQKEIYSDMFVDCFGLLLSHLDGEAAARLICATCVCRLRDAAGFRCQVLRCEELLLARIHGTDGENNEVKLEAGVKEETINVDMEAAESGDDTHHADDDIEENTLPASSTPRRKSLRQKLKRNKKKKTIRTESTVAAEIAHPDGDQTHLQFQEYNIQEPKPPKQNGCRADNPKLNNDILTIIENSYVCPFDTSFSDYFCIYCREVFTDPQKLRDHTMTHDPTTFKDVLKNTSSNKKLQIDIYRIDCRLCPEQIGDLEHFKLHSSIHGKTFGDTKDYLKFKLTQGKLSCTECDATFGFFHALKKHMAEHFGTCICDMCGAHYFEERMLLLHQKTHQNAKVEKSFPCKECGKSFKSKYARHIHTARTHTREAAYQCSKCDEEFFSYTLRYRHMMAAHGEQRSFPCEQCERAYDSRKSLREHYRRHHLKILKHQCELCDKRFYLPSRLKEHMASHTGERNFRCERCGKSYPRLRGLKSHLQSHAPHARRPCAHCGAAFAHAANLANHVRRHHPPAPPAPPAPAALQ